MDKLKNATMLHYVIRTDPDKDRSPIHVEAINAINPFIKPGYNYVSVSVNEKNLKEFYEQLENGFVEAYFYY